MHKRSRLKAALACLILIGAGGFALVRSQELSSGGTMTPQGLQLRLAEGSDLTQEPRRIHPGSGAPLAPAEAEAVLSRLERLAAEAADVQEFSRREDSLPPPLTGTTLQTQFPPAAPSDANAPTEAAAPVEVLRFAPEGAVEMAGRLSVTFSQPMVPLTSHDELAKSDVPVRLSPDVPGHWRWIGTKTLLFEPSAERLPMATEYRAEVPAGTKSATGGALAAAKAWSFSTPPLHLVQSYPGSGPTVRQPVIFLLFDQKIRPQELLPHLKLTAGSTAAQLRLATEAEVAADASVSSMIPTESTQEGRWLALMPAEPLPLETNITVTLEAGAPSAEGPRTTTEAQAFSFQTYSPLKIANSYCNWYESPCAPFDPWTVEFNNPLDPKKFQASMVTVQPELPGFKASVEGNRLVIQGRSAGRTEYSVKLDAGITDQFGQTLGSSKSVTFKVGSTEPMLTASGETMVIADPTSAPSYSVYSVNHKVLRVSLYSVTPADWDKYRAYLRDVNYNDQRREPPGQKVQQIAVETGGVPDQLTETRVDLTPALKNGLGHVILVVEPPPSWAKLFKISSRDAPRIVIWIQCTKIGLEAFRESDSLVGWASSLQDGKPLPGVELTLAGGAGRPVATSADGTASLGLAQEASATPNSLVAKLGEDTAFLPENVAWWDSAGTWNRVGHPDSLRWFIFDDRGMYRPAEEVHVKGWVRRQQAGKTGELTSAGGRSLGYHVYDAYGNDILQGTSAVDELGGFDLRFTLPDTLNLGDARVDLTLDGASGVDSPSTSHSFQVQEFRRPEFEVTASVSEGPHLVGGSLEATVRASYYAGGGLPGAETQWSVSSAAASFAPPNWDEFSFGSYSPWWWDFDRPAASASEAKSFSGHTDMTGAHRLKIDLVSVDPPRAMTLTAQASVMDVNRQAWTATTTALVHPADLYVGLKLGRGFVEAGQPIELQSIVADLDGAAVAGQAIRLGCVRLDWSYENGEWKTIEADAQSLALTSAAAPVDASFATREGGMYRIQARIRDAKGRENQTQVEVWVAGGKTIPQREVGQEKVTLIPDQAEYQPGAVAQVLVQSPFYPAEGLATWRREGILSQERFSMAGPSHTLRVPLTEAHLPGLTLQVDLLGASARTDDAGKVDEKLPKRPAYAMGSVVLPVSLRSRTLDVSVAPSEAAAAPGSDTQILLQVKDAAGAPAANAEVAVVAVDESILALSGYQMPDPLGLFYTARDPGVSDFHSRQYVQLANPEVLASRMQEAGQKMKDGFGRGGRMMESRPMMAMAAPMPQAEGAMDMDDEPGAGAASTPIQVRSNFNPLALFAPAVKTDADGRARVPFKLPDNLTRYRLMAVAVAGERQFGKGESSLTARLPLMVRPSAPRFLNFGDRFEFPVVVQNQTDAPLSVDVALRATNLKVEGSGFRVMVPPNDRVEVRFPASTERAGTARYQVAAASGAWADAASGELPVWTPATTEAFATYGELDEGLSVQPVQAPGEVWPQFGGLEVTTSSTTLQALTDAVIYLMAYPFECAEQVSSRVLAVAALKDVLAAFHAEGLPSEAEMLAATGRDIERLRGLQGGNGGFGLWRKDQEPWPYVSIHVTHALIRARDKGFIVPQDMLDQALNYLRSIDSYIPAVYGPEARRSLRSYALYVRALADDRDPKEARKILREVGVAKMPLEALGWLLPVLHGDVASKALEAEILTHLQNRVAETAGAAHFVTSYEEGDYLLMNSDRRTDGVLLEALIGVAPKSDLIPKLVRGLLGHRNQGRWGNTQENAFILLALDRYFQTYEKQTPDFVARIWLGDKFAGQHEYHGHTTERNEVKIPMSMLSGTQNLVLSKEGPGRLYYRLGLRYAPKSLDLKPADQGFVVERRYEAIEKPDDVKRDADGTWRIRAGAQVRVRLTMVAPARRTHVALVDPLPAGLEAMNPALSVTGDLPQDPQEQEARRGWWWWNPVWYEHQNLRDERAEAFTSMLWEGVYNYTYIARATTPGSFVVPPAKAEEMYAPETFGRGATDRVIVEER